MICVHTRARALVIINDCVIYIGLETMSLCSIATTAATPVELQQAYSGEDEEFYGVFEEEMLSDQHSTSDSDGDELGSTDSDSETLCRTFDEQDDDDQVLIANQDADKRAVREQLRRGCGCSFDCYKQFTDEEIFRVRLQMQELEKPLRDFYLLGKLQILSRGAEASVSHSRQTSSTKRQRVTYQYAYDHRVVCKAAFCFIHCIGEKVLKNLSKHLKDNGVVPREHGNKRRLPLNSFSFETVQNMVEFIRNYATVFGLPQPAARRGRASTAPVYLPASEGYNTVHHKYVEACTASGKQAAKYHAFRQIWLQCVPDIQFMTPRSDVCHHCEEYRVLISKAVTEDDKLKLAEEFKGHVDEAQKERQYYLDSMKKAEESAATLSGNRRYCHYTFDFAQMLQIPYHARQVGPIYFKVPLKVQLFGICNDATKQQVNYLFSESESIGPNGSKAHCPNAVISMIHHYLEVHSSNEEICHLHADNCVGQNKNRYVTAYLLWRVLTGKHKKITLSFMRVGHTRCMVDGNFGLIKRVYRHSDVDTVAQLSDIVSRSCLTNIPQLYSWQWREWDTMLAKLFTPLKGIRKFQHFTFAEELGGKVLVKQACDGEEKTLTLLQKGTTVRKVKSACLPKILKPPGITQERQEYLHSQIAEHVWPEYRDITCPAPQ